MISPNSPGPTPARLAFAHLWRRIALPLLLLLVVPAACLYSAASPPQIYNSESSYALIFGTVWGPDDRPVYGIKVKIRRAGDKRARWEVYSDHRGEFAQRVPAGKAEYVLWSDCKDCKTPDGKRYQAGPEVVVQVEEDERVNTGLHLK